MKTLSVLNTLNISAASEIVSYTVSQCQFIYDLIPQPSHVKKTGKAENKS